MIAGWTLAACGAALGLAIVGGMVFHGERPEKMGYAIEGVVEEGEGGGEAQVPIATLLASADPAKGADVFKKCAACHTINAGGANGIGPNLHAVLGAPIGQGKGYGFSDALKGVGGNWDFEKMSAWLLSPRKFAPGTKMTFAGLSNGQDRANVIAYLNSQGSNLPLPAPPAPGETIGNTGATDPKAAEAIQNAEAGETATVANTGSPQSGVPSLDPGAKEQSSKIGR